MVIQDSDYILTQINEHSPKWDLELLYTIRPKGKEPRQEFKNVGYGMPLEHAVHRIINYRIHNKYPEGAIQMKDYIKEFRDQVKTLEKIFNIYEKSIKDQED